MARRRKQEDSILDDLFEFLKDAHTWLGPVLALVLLLLIRFVCPLFFTSKQGAVDFGVTIRQWLPAISWFVAAIVMLVWLVAEAHKLANRQPRSNFVSLNAPRTSSPKRPAQQSVQQTQPEMKSEGTPACPACGATMILRTARKGKNAGSQFWGCSQYPQCKGTR